MVSAPVRREQVAFACKRGVASRRACALLGTARSGLKLTPTRPLRDAPVLSRMREIAAQHPRKGYRFVRILLAREGQRMCADRALRLWRVGGLQVPKKRGRRRVSSNRPRPNAAAGANQVWAMDFVFDTCADGRNIKCLTIVDEWTREALAIDVARSIRSKRVIDVLARLVSVRGAPHYIRCDNGPEFVSTAILAWALAEGIEIAFSDPGKPWQNGTNESFNGRFRDECLSQEWFRNLREATALIETWRRYYNDKRPHSSLGGLTPSEFRRKYDGSEVKTQRVSTS